MTVYELIQELAYFKADTPVFVKIRNTNTEFEIDPVVLESREMDVVSGVMTNRAKIIIDGEEVQE